MVVSCTSCLENCCRLLWHRNYSPFSALGFPQIITILYKRNYLAVLGAPPTTFFFLKSRGTGSPRYQPCKARDRGRSVRFGAVFSLLFKLVDRWCISAELENQLRQSSSSSVSHWHSKAAVHLYFFIVKYMCI